MTKSFINHVTKKPYEGDNPIILSAQGRGDTEFAGFNQWLSVGRIVKKGEKAVKIKMVQSFNNTDEATGESVQKTWCKRVPVFGLSQTEENPDKAKLILSAKTAKFEAKGKTKKPAASKEYSITTRRHPVTVINGTAVIV